MPYRQLSPSPIELSFWEAAKPLIPELQREVRIDNKYWVDFLIPSRKVVVELYGFRYHKTKKKLSQDAARERYLQIKGYQVVRFIGPEVYQDVHKCVRDLIAILSSQPVPPHGASAHFPTSTQSQTARPAAPSPLSPSGPSLNQATAIPKTAAPTPANTSRYKITAQPRKKRVFGLEVWQVLVLAGLSIAVVAVLVTLTILALNLGGA